MVDVRWYHEDRFIDDANDDRYTASSEGDIYRLEVNSVSESELGRYTVVISLNGLNATDSVQLRIHGMLFQCNNVTKLTLTFPFLVPATAAITPSSVTVNEGEELMLFCEAGGTGALTVSWTMADGSPLPLGVQENGNEIFIASATSSHSGTYVCAVNNLAGTSQDEVIVNVFCEQQIVTQVFTSIYVYLYPSVYRPTYGCCQLQPVNLRTKSTSLP